MNAFLMKLIAAQITVIVTFTFLTLPYWGEQNYLNASVTFLAWTIFVVFSLRPAVLACLVDLPFRRNLRYATKITKAKVILLSNEIQKYLAETSKKQKKS